VPQQLQQSNQRLSVRFTDLENKQEQAEIQAGTLQSDALHLQKEKQELRALVTNLQQFEESLIEHLKLKASHLQVLDIVTRLDFAGEFVEIGVCHGKTCYKRCASKLGEDVKTSVVFLYFGDDCNGAVSNGWFVGPKLGSKEVWLGCSSQDDMPPHRGHWVPREDKEQTKKIPFDPGKLGVEFVGPDNGLTDVPHNTC
jgi:hypothetical protein